MLKNLTFIMLLGIAFCNKSFGQVTISYTSPAYFTVGVPVVSFKPTGTGTGITNYTISPTLPNGLSFDNTTGIISGTPTAVAAASDYTVTGNNAGTPATFTLRITVISVQPYTPYSGYFTVNQEITSMKPSGGGAANTVYKMDSNSVLPDGLRLNAETGEICGTPSKAEKTDTYKIIATDIAGAQTHYEVYITTVPAADIVAIAPTIRFVGQGSVQQSLNSGEKIAANTGIGVIYRQNSNKAYGILHSIEIDFSINVASTVDTIRSINNPSDEVTNKADFGSSVLLPLNSGQAFAFSFKGYFSRRGGNNGNYRRNAGPKPLGGVLSGFNIYLTGSNRNWEYDYYYDPAADPATKKPATPVKTSLLSFYAGPFFEFITPTADNKFGKNASITLGLGYSGRWILGDAQQGNQIDFRKKILGTDRNYFGGAELTLALRFYNIKAEVHLPFLSNKGGVPGLTGTHLTTFIGFSGGFPIDLKQSATEE